MTAGGPLADTVVAGSIAAVVSGAPSTAYALATGESVVEATLAAGTLLLGGEERATRLLPAAAVAHAALSLGWAAVLARLLPRRHTAAWGVPAGLLIAVLDLGIVGRRRARIRALPRAPQIADHVAYAVTVGAVLSRRRRQQPSTSQAAPAGTSA
ncbi:MAG: hypothetical protein QOG15_347 [Solirubrobacteraceae bacterium]|nr:hypothetical protein [Solirubrobacteraceae bacterium]